MTALLAMQITLLTLIDHVTTGVRARRDQLRAKDRQAGLSTLEITIIALGLFLLAGAAVLALTTATNNRLGRIS